ncbi:MAG: hypothetical protein JO121_02460 [Deltaproteobacteria bacterium]|nr:hypothetical protein [Deltaproteobacteria bacterium]
MGLFEESIKDGMSDPEFRAGWLEAEEELRAYYASLSMPEITASADIVVARVTNAANPIPTKIGASKVLTTA